MDSIHKLPKKNEKNEWSKLQVKGSNNGSSKFFDCRRGD